MIRDLDNDSFQEREKATEELIKLGKEIEEDVKRVLASDSAEVGSGWSASSKRSRTERRWSKSCAGGGARNVLERISAGGQEKVVGQPARNWSG